MKVVVNTLVCDTLECGNFVIQEPNLKGDALREFNKILKKLGWTKMGKENYCPNCSHPEYVAKSE